MVDLAFHKQAKQLFDVFEVRGILLALVYVISDGKVLTREMGRVFQTRDLIGVLWSIAMNRSKKFTQDLDICVNLHTI